MATKELATVRTKELATGWDADARYMIESHSLAGALSGEHDGIVLSGWLNAAKGSAAHQRIAEIINLIHAAVEGNNEARAMGAYKPHVRRQGAPPRKVPQEQKAKLREVDAVYDQLQRALARYVYHVGLAMVIPDSSWALNFYGPKQDGDFIWENELKSSASKAARVVPPFATYRVMESDAALAALRLAERGLIGSVRLCATCSETWVFAKHKNYRFCSKACRERSFMDSSEYRERKRNQMRKYREQERKRNAVALFSIKKKH